MHEIKKYYIETDTSDSPIEIDAYDDKVAIDFAQRAFRSSLLIIYDQRDDGEMRIVWERNHRK